MVDRKRQDSSKQKAADWVSSHLATEYGASADQVKRSHRLRHWGFRHERHYAKLTRAFNHATHVDPEWQGKAVAPPDLFRAVNDGSVGALVDFVAAKTGEQLPPVPPPKDVQTFLLGELRKGGHTNVTKDSVIGRDISIDQNKEVEIEAHFTDTFKIDIGNVIKSCIPQDSKKTYKVSQLASCIIRSIRARRRQLQ